jgi:FtsP/CotA-like multicopper oxidase with cupredoxin domain
MGRSAKGGTARRFVATVMPCLALGVLVVAGPERPAHATSGGSPYVVPLAVDTNPSPTVFETTIVAQDATVDIGGGLMANVMTFNGAIPGPHFDLNVGDTVIVHFENQLMGGHVTGIHWHGIELANASDGTPLTQNQVPPGGKFIYKFIVPRPGIYWYHPHHHASTNQVFRGMYGTIYVRDPSEGALIGLGVLPTAAETRTLVLSDVTVCKTAGSNDAATYDPALPHVSGGPLPAQPGPTPVVLCETPFDDDGNVTAVPLAAGDVPNIQPAGHSGRVNEGQTVLTNGVNVGGRAGTPAAPGVLAPGALTSNVQPGRGLRLKLINPCPVRFFRLRLTPSTGVLIPLVHVGGQGGLLDAAVLDGGISPTGFDLKYNQGQVLLDPGDRIDVVAVIPAAATGVATLWTEDFSRTGTGFSNIPTVPVAHFNVTGAPGAYAIAAGTPLRTAVGAFQEVLGPPTDILLDPATFTPALGGMAAQDIKLTATGGTSLSIDNVVGDHDFVGIDYTVVPHFLSARYAQIGDLLQLSVTNKTGAHHPFHLHGFSIQPLTLQTDPPGPASFTFPVDFRDNVDVPAASTLHFRIRLDDRPQMDGVTPGGAIGRWVFHCHIFFHATFGMISEFVVLAPPAGNERPYVNADATQAFGPSGGTATMTGTYFDPDGDAVTLTGPVIGTLVDNGGGTWSWSGPADCGDDGTLLYVTATDAIGQTDVAVFQLVVGPSVATAVSRKVLWPATKGPLDAGASIGVSACGPAPTRAVRVFSDEAVGAPPYAPDAIVSTVPPLPVGQTFSLKLRAERLVPGNGRIYVVVGHGADGAMTALDAESVICPQNLTAGHLTALLLEADLAEASADVSPTGDPAAPWNIPVLPLTPLPPP